MKRRVVVTDTMQQGYVYFRTEPAGRNFAPGFSRSSRRSRCCGSACSAARYMTDCREEFPASWFARAKLCTDRHDPRLNYFGVNASQSLAEWRRNGWIHPQDPRGWFQWYCRYYMGRRTRDDAQADQTVARHRGATSPPFGRTASRGDVDCRRKQRQAVLHWAYDSRRI